MRRTAGRVVVCAVMAGGVLVGCGDDEDGGERTASGNAATAQTTASEGGPAQAAAKVSIKNFEYVPASVTIKSGGKVTWTNQDTAPHNAENTGEPGPVEFKTKTPLNKGDSDSVTFSKPGTYSYYCIYHRFMKADVIVK